MLKLTLSALAASTIALAVPASAQVHVHSSDRGVGVPIFGVTGLLEELDAVRLQP